MENIFKHPYIGPWEFDEFPDGESDTVIKHQECPIIKIRGTDDFSCIEEDEVQQMSQEQIALAVMVQRAPEVTRGLFEAYAYLAQFMAPNHRNTAKGQQLLASLRSTLSDALGKDPQEVEAEAYDYILNEFIDK